MSVESLKTRNDLSVYEFEQLMNEETDINVYKKLSFLKLKAEGYSTKKAYTIANLKKIIGLFNTRSMECWRI